MEAVGIEPTSGKLGSEPSTGLSDLFCLAWSLTERQVGFRPVPV